MTVAPPLPPAPTVGNTRHRWEVRLARTGESVVVDGRAIDNVAGDLVVFTGRVDEAGVPEVAAWFRRCEVAYWRQV